MNSCELELLRYQNKYLKEALLLIVQDLARAGMSNYTPNNEEFLSLAKWGYGLFNELGLDLKDIEIYTEEVLK